MVHPSRVRNGSVNPRSNFGQPSVKLGQPWSTWSKLVKPPQILENVLRIASWGHFEATGPCEVGPAWSGLSRFARRHSRNPGGKNGVMTVAPSLFGVSWYKEGRTKNK